MLFGALSADTAASPPRGATSFGHFVGSSNRRRSNQRENGKCPNVKRATRFLFVFIYLFFFKRKSNRLILFSIRGLSGDAIMKYFFSLFVQFCFAKLGTDVVSLSSTLSLVIWQRCDLRMISGPIWPTRNGHGKRTMSFRFFWGASDQKHSSETYFWNFCNEFSFRQ